jgi:insertion element IS1 protein InsB
MIDRLLLEKIPLAGIARAVQVSETWLQSYVNEKYQRVEKQVKVHVKKGL